MNKLLRAILSFSFLSGLFQSCQKEPDASILGTPVSKCILTHARYYDETGALDDSTVYVYTAERPTTLYHVDYYTTLEYSNNKVDKKNYFEIAGASTAVGYDQFSYNPDGSLSRADFYLTDPAIPAPVLVIATEFTYSGGKMVKVTQREDLDANGTLDPSYEFTYTYTGNNITRCIIADMANGAADTLSYEYDNNNNYYAKNPLALYTDYLFENYSGELLPFILSANNVVLLKQPSGNIPISYALDNNQNLAELRISGQTAARYTYQCQ